MQNNLFYRHIKVALPSFSSSILGVFVVLLITGYTFLATVYTGSEESVLINSINNGAIDNNKFIAAYQHAYDAIIERDFLGNISLFVFWSVVGAVVYFAAAGLIKSLGEVHHFQEELHYVHINRRAAILEAVERFVIQLSGLMLWFAFLRLLTKFVIPHAVTFANIAALEPDPLVKTRYIIASVVLVVTAVYVNSVLLRIIALRVRLFGNQE